MLFILIYNQYFIHSYYKYNSNDIYNQIMIEILFYDSNMIQFDQRSSFNIREKSIQLKVKNEINLYHKEKLGPNYYWDSNSCAQT